MSGPLCSNILLLDFFNISIVSFKFSTGGTNSIELALQKPLNSSSSSRIKLSGKVIYFLEYFVLKKFSVLIYSFVILLVQIKNGFRGLGWLFGHSP
jgi:hypothetical protein